MQMCPLIMGWGQAQVDGVGQHNLRTVVLQCLQQLQVIVLPKRIAPDQFGARAGEPRGSNVFSIDGNC